MKNKLITAKEAIEQTEETDNGKKTIMEIATSFEEVEDKGIGREVTQNPYIIAFTEKMMEMSNEIQKEWMDLEDIEEEFMPAIREFIYNMTGL